MHASCGPPYRKATWATRSARPFLNSTDCCWAHETCEYAAWAPRSARPSYSNYPCVPPVLQIRTVEHDVDGQVGWYSTIFYNGVDVSLELTAIAGSAVPSTGESTNRSNHFGSR